MVKTSELRLKTNFDDFDQHVNVLLGELGQLSALQIVDEQGLTTLETRISEWYKATVSLLKKSFNFENNHFESDFRKDLQTGVNKVNLQLPLHERIKKKKDWLLNAKLALQIKRNLLSVSDVILGISTPDDVKELKGNVSAMMTIIMRKLNKLPGNSYYSIEDILTGNGFTFDDNHEWYQVFSNLVQKGLVDGIGRGYGKLTVDGKLTVEEYEAELKVQEMQAKPEKQDKKDRIFISHSHKDEEIVAKFIEMILHNALNIDPGKFVFCTSFRGSKPISGEDFKNRVKAELVDSKIVLQFISENYKQSEVCLNEMGAAWVVADRVLPLIVYKDKFDVGFINSNTIQTRLGNKDDLLELTDILKGYGFSTSPPSTSRINKKIEEFIAYFEGIGNMDKSTVNTSTGEPTDTDLTMLLTYLDSKNITACRISMLERGLHHKFTKEFILKLMEKYPNRITRTKVKGEDGVKNLGPTYPNPK